MKIYPASNNPGPRRKEKEKYNQLNVPRRLISYWQIVNKDMDCDTLFEWCKNVNLFKGGYRSGFRKR